MKNLLLTIFILTTASAACLASGSDFIDPELLQTRKPQSKLDTNLGKESPFAITNTGMTRGNIDGQSYKVQKCIFTVILPDLVKLNEFYAANIFKLYHKNKELKASIILSTEDPSSIQFTIKFPNTYYKAIDGTLNIKVPYDAQGWGTPFWHEKIVSNECLEELRTRGYTPLYGQMGSPDTPVTQDHFALCGEANDDEIPNIIAFKIVLSNVDPVALINKQPVGITRTESPRYPIPRGGRKGSVTQAESQRPLERSTSFSKNLTPISGGVGRSTILKRDLSPGPTLSSPRQQPSPRLQLKVPPLETPLAARSFTRISVNFDGDRSYDKGKSIHLFTLSFYGDPREYVKCLIGATPFLVPVSDSKVPLKLAFEYDPHEDSRIKMKIKFAPSYRRPHTKEEIFNEIVIRQKNVYPMVFMYFNDAKQTWTEKPDSLLSNYIEQTPELQSMKQDRYLPLSGEKNSQSHTSSPDGIGFRIKYYDKIESPPKKLSPTGGNTQGVQGTPRATS